MTAESARPAGPAEENKGGGAPLGVVALVLLILGGFVLIPRLFTPPRNALENTDAPDFAAKVILNEKALAAPHEPRGSVSLKELQGHPVIIDFWASWCGPCQVETPLVNRLAQRFSSRGLVVLGVDVGEEENDGRQWAVTHGITFPIVFDGEREVSGPFNVRNLPTLVVVSKTGKIVAVRSGMADDGELEHLVQLAL